MLFSPSTDTHIIVSYHYVRDPDPAFSGIHPCSVAEFRRQIAFLRDTYQLVSVGEVYEAAREGSTRKACAITLDDGTKDHYENALPVLLEYQAPAMFDIISGVFRGVVPLAHKVHALLSRGSTYEIILRFNDLLKEAGGEENLKWHVPVDRPYRGSKRIDFGGDIAEENFKEIITTAPPSVSGAFVSRLFEESGFSDRAFVEDFFMSIQEVKDVLAQGYMLGNHTDSHRALDTLSAEEVAEEMSRSFGFFREHLGAAPRILSYPYGRGNDDTYDIVGKHGITHAVTIERRSVKAGDNPLALPRFDTNDIRDFLDHAH